MVDVEQKFHFYHLGSTSMDQIEPIASTNASDHTQLARLSSAASAGLATLDGAIVEQVVIGGDLARLTPDQRIEYYRAVCGSLGLNPLTQPFEYIRLNDKLRLYAKREATDQLRRIHGISVQIVSREQQGDLYVVTARATSPDGRNDESTGVVTTAGLNGNALANAWLKAETKAKRRVTLSICGLGWLDETEVETVRQARPVRIDESGDVVDVTLRPSAELPPAPSEPHRTSHAENEPLPHSVSAPHARHGREKLLRRWEALCVEADALGLLLEDLPRDADEQTIIARGTALRARVEQAIRARDRAA